MPSIDQYLAGAILFEFSLYISLAILVLGAVFQSFKFRREGRFFKGSKPRKSISTFFQFKEVFLNTILQIKLFKAGKIRWGFHFLLFLGFLYLVFVHALHDVTAPVFFPGYDPTVDPYQFLRNLTGVLVLIGCVGFLVRRVKGDSHKRKLQSGKKLQPGKKIHGKSVKSKGVISILLIALLICSGFLLEASKIISEPVFIEMVEEYSDLDEGADLLDLKLFWETNYHVVFTEDSGANPNGLENGRI